MVKMREHGRNLGILNGFDQIISATIVSEVKGKLKKKLQADPSENQI
jgi:hypothetical protein